MTYDQMLRWRAIKKKTAGCCGVCHGRGYLPEVNRGVPNPCRCMRVLDYLGNLIEVGIPEHYWALGLKEMTIAPQYKKLVQWYNSRMERAAAKGLGLVFLGSNGIGKTSLMCEIGKEAVVNGYKVRYLTVQAYVDSVRVEPIDLSDAKFVLLDELDKVYIAKVSDYAVKQTEELLRKLTSQNKCLILCSNFDIDSLRDTFGESLVSLLNRYAKLVNVTGEDYSRKLQDRWEHSMESELDYYHEEIVSRAETFHQRETKEEIEAWT